MIQLVYVSSSVQPFTSSELLQLLDKARRNNEKLAIAGILLYKDGDFMQALEGEEEPVHSLSARIAKDPRHKDIRILLNGACTEREFPDWSMGFRNLNDLNPLGSFFCCSKLSLKACLASYRSHQSANS